MVIYDKEKLVWFTFPIPAELLLHCLSLFSAYVEQEASCYGYYSAKFLTYAHSQLNRVLVSEIHAVSGNDSQMAFNVNDLSGVESADMVWQAPEQIDEDTM